MSRTGLRIGVLEIKIILLARLVQFKFELPQDIDRDDIEDVPVNLKDHSLFVGFAPVDNPEIVVAAVVENVGGGSKYAASIAMKIINNILS